MAWCILGTLVLLCAAAAFWLWYTSRENYW
jgi:hypothetical protein